MARSKQSTKSKVELKCPDRYDVIFLNDDYTPMDFVVQLLIEVFNKNLEQAKVIMMNIHENGKGIAGSYNYEVAEQKVHEAQIICRHNGHPLKIILEKLV